MRAALYVLFASAVLHLAAPEARAGWFDLSPQIPPDTVSYTVRVLDAQKKPIEGVRVSATWVSGPTRSANTDKSGAATLKLPGHKFSSIYVKHLGSMWLFNRTDIPENGVLVLDPKTARPEK